MAIKPKLSDQEFIAAYYRALKAGHGITEFARQIGTEMRTAWSRVNYFRKKKGIPLPPLAKAHPGPAPKSAPTPKAKRSYVIRAVVPAEDFIRAWQLAENMEQVQEKTGIPRELARAKANKLRKIGIPLKQIKLNNHRDKLDIPALIALAESLAPRPEPVA